MTCHGTDADYIEHPLQVAGLGMTRMFVFPHNEGSALVHGTIADNALVRLHSACQYGEIYGSLECDCRAQLDASLDAVAAAGAGVVIHLLTHEGRGAGLRAKAHAYWDRHQLGIDTFTSYEKQGLPGDKRNYDVAVEFLRNHLGLNRIRLLTNNPNKLDAVDLLGIDVERVPLLPVVPADGADAPVCDDYLRAKADHGHLIPIP